MVRSSTWTGMSDQVVHDLNIIVPELDVVGVVEVLATRKV